MFLYVIAFDLLIIAARYRTRCLKPSWKVLLWQRKCCRACCEWTLTSRRDFCRAIALPCDSTACSYTPTIRCQHLTGTCFIFVFHVYFIFIGLYFFLAIFSTIFLSFCKRSTLINGVTKILEHIFYFFVIIGLHFYSRSTNLFKLNEIFKFIYLIYFKTCPVKSSKKQSFRTWIGFF